MADSSVEWVDGLRRMADWFEAHPERVPSIGFGIDLFPPFGSDQEEADWLAAIARELPHPLEKDVNSAYFWVRARFGPHTIEANAHREQVCERVQVGTEIVTVADPKAPRIEVEQPVYEWHCPDSILAP